MRPSSTAPLAAIAAKRPGLVFVFVAPQLESPELRAVPGKGRPSSLKPTPSSPNRRSHRRVLRPLESTLLEALPE